MTSRDFCYWLQGYFELSMAGDEEGKANGSPSLSPYEVTVLRNHLRMVFAHEIDPSFGKAQKPVLDKFHQGEIKIPNGSGIETEEILIRC